MDAFITFPCDGCQWSASCVKIVRCQHQRQLTMAESIGTNVVIISILFSILAIISVFLRFRARLAQRAQLGADDYTVVPALVSINLSGF